VRGDTVFVTLSPAAGVLWNGEQVRAALESKLLAAGKRQGIDGSG
jgi:hypothetical protein